MSFDFVGTDNAAVRICGRIFPIDVASELGYIPKEIECTVSIGTSMHDVDFKIKDKNSGNFVSYRLRDLITRFGGTE